MQPLEQATAGAVRRARAHHLDLVWGAVPWEAIDAGLLARCTDAGTAPCCDLTAQHLLAVLGDPDAMPVDGKGRLGAMAIGTPVPQSTHNLLKLPPKGGGFAPPNRRQ